MQEIKQELNQGAKPEMEKDDKSKDIEIQLNQAQREINVLYEISAAMRTTLELDQILYIILTGVTSHTGLGFNRAILFLINEKNHTLECKMAIGPNSGEHANRIWKFIEESNQKMDDLIHVDISQAVTQSSLYDSLKNIKFPLKEENQFLLPAAYNRGTPWHLASQELQHYEHDPFLKIFHTSELILMPLRAKDKVNGLIVADNIYTKKPITKEEIKMFTLVANQAGLAIENSHLYEMIVTKSHTDSLTGLWNHGFFQETLDYEIKVAQQHHRALSLAMIDIDNFKSINDTYGHHNGDIILRDLAKVLKDSSRETDYVCRYGGEEFSIIFVNTTKDAGYEIAERLRAKIAQSRFQNFSPNPDINITVSVGLASFPDNARVKEDLISFADKAMYIAKFSGKNKTCITDMKNI